ncbi:MAG: hypothetical protein JSU86_16375 [Phycisphaerales bacterium]|nr:MAG: hypothetical protein JSU86_16375 [Phycisphaerales bacterium]
MLEDRIRVWAAYLGTFSVQASEDAAGTFEVYVTAENGSSSLHTSTNEPIGFVNPKATVTVGKRRELRGGFERE